MFGFVVLWSRKQFNTLLLWSFRNKILMLNKRTINSDSLSPVQTVFPTKREKYFSVSPLWMPYFSLTIKNVFGIGVTSLARQTSIYCYKIGISCCICSNHTEVRKVAGWVRMICLIKKGCLCSCKTSAWNNMHYLLMLFINSCSFPVGTIGSTSKVSLNWTDAFSHKDKKPYN